MTVFSIFDKIKHPAASSEALNPEEIKKITPDTLVVFCLGILGSIQRRWNHTHIDIQWMRILSVHYFLRPLFLMLRDIYLGHSYASRAVLVYQKSKIAFPANCLRDISQTSLHEPPRQF